MSSIFYRPTQAAPEICPADKAGTWYPKSSTELKAELNTHLENAALTVTGKPRILVVPHPGLAYGGPTAAYAYKLAGSHPYRTIYILATSHLTTFQNVLIGDFDAYDTPLGPLPGNRDVSSWFFHQNPGYITHAEAIRREHSLEMQYPYIKLLFPDTQIVPIVLSAAFKDSAHQLAQDLYSILTPDDLVLISTDLSHYPEYAEAEALDLATLRTLTQADPNAFISYMNTLSLPANTSTAACGEVGLLTGLYLAQLLHDTKGVLLHYENSGDRPAGDKTKVVGYGAVAFMVSDQEQFAETVTLTQKEKDGLLVLARQTLVDGLQNRMPQTPEIQFEKTPPRPVGVFVTLTKSGQLRGCMGQFEQDKPLPQLIVETALMSAVQDPRFPQVTVSELAQISISISVLGPRKRITDFRQIIPGKHGVYIRKGNRGGTYLPQVAPEQGWNREAMMTSLCGHKSGIDANAWKDGSAEMDTYTALVFGEEK